jgi:autotransporter-associated beta strand protein
VNAVSGSHLGFGSYSSVALNQGGVIAGNWQWNGDGTLGVSSSGDVTNTINGSLNLRADSGANHSFNVANGAAAIDLRVNAILTDSYPEAWWLSPSVLIKNGAGTMALTASNSYDGNTIVNAGTLRLGNGTTNTNLANAADVVVASGATLHLDYSGTDTIDELWLGGVRKSPGIYSSANSGGFITGTGTLTVISGPPSDYDTWAAANSLTAGSQGDDDKDGASNFIEYAFGLNPKSGGSSSPYVSLPRPLDAKFTYLRRKFSLSGLSFSVWASTDLATWSEDAGAIQTVTPLPNSENELVEVLPSPGLLSANRIFLRVQCR